MSANLARGPLSSPAGQWLVLGLGGLAATGKDNVNAAFQTLTRAALQLAGDVDATRSVAGTQHQQQPIVIHTGGASSSSATGARYYVATLMQLTIGAGACWVGYVAITTFLPESVKELLPVTRRFFEIAVSTLGKSILAVRDALSERMDVLSAKQDELSTKLDSTHDEVLAVRGDVSEVRSDLESIHASVLRCEDKITDSEGGRERTARGVGLLVRCVRALLPGNATLASELDRFSREAEEEERARGGGGGSDPDAADVVKGSPPSDPSTPPPRRPISRQTSAEFAAGGPQQGQGQQQQNAAPGGGDDGCDPQQQTPSAAAGGRPPYRRMGSVPESGNVDADVQGLMSMLARSGSFVSVRAA